MSKTHTLIVRGISKDEKNSLKRMAKKSIGKLSVNQIVLGIINFSTAKEISEHKSKKPNHP